MRILRPQSCAASHLHSFAIGLGGEESPDLVPTLDGANNSKTWTTVHQTGYLLVGESNPTMNNDPNITRFLGGTLTVTDYAAVRK